MKKYLPKIVLCLLLLINFTIIGIALDAEPEPVKAPSSAPASAPAPVVAPVIEPASIPTAKIKLPDVKPKASDLVTRYVDKYSASGGVATFKPTIVGKKYMVTAPHFVVTQVVDSVFARGGNFWDAAAAGMWMTELCGGQLTAGTATFALWNAEEGKAYSYCGVGNASAIQTIEGMIERFGDDLKSPAGFIHPPRGTKPDHVWGRTNVAATPDNIFALLIKYGTMSFTECYQEVLDYMENGWPLRTSYADIPIGSALYREPWLSDPAWEANRLHWRQNGKYVRAGDLMREPGLARTIRAMMKAEQDALAAGFSREQALRAARDWYYTGPIAWEVDRLSRENGGFLRYEDYADYSGWWDDQKNLPHTNFLGIDFYTNPTYTQAGVLVLVLNILENFDMVSLGWNTPEYLHVITQAFDLAFSDRWEYFGDPHYCDIPDGLWSKEYGVLRASLIDMNSRFQEAPPAGDPINMKAVLEGWKPLCTPEQAALAWADPELKEAIAAAEIDPENGIFGDTTLMLMIDTDGNVFSYCPSDGRNSTASIQIPGWGVGIPYRGRQFTLIPELPSSLAPGKRPVTTPHTWVASKDGEGLLAIQSPGGDQQIQAAVPILLNWLLWGMEPQVAIDQPRVCTSNYFSQFTPHVAGYYVPGQTQVDKELPEETIKGLEALGHKIRMGSLFHVGSNTPEFVLRDPDTGLVYGATSCKSEGYAFGK